MQARKLSDGPSRAGLRRIGAEEHPAATRLRDEAFHANLPIALPVAVVNAVVLAGLSWFEHPDPAYIGWAALVVLVTGARWALLVHDRKRAQLPGSLPLAGAALSGALWGAFLFLAPDDPASIARLGGVFMLAGMAAAAALAFAPYIGLVIAFNAPLLGLAFANLLLTGRPLEQALSVVILLFFLVTTALAWRARLQLGRAITARAEAEAQAIEISRLAAEMKRAAAEAEAGSKGKSVFLARMSHDLRTPLNGIIGLSQLLETTELDDEQREFTATIGASGRTLLGLIENLLELARLEGGLARLDPEEFELRATLDDLVEAGRRQLDGKPVDIRLEIDSDLPSLVWGDEKRLRQAIGALIANASRFTLEGEICVAARPAGRGQVRFELTDSGEDPGDGDAAFVERPSGRTPPSRRRAGTAGMGLDIARSVVALAGGQIGAERVEGGGAKIWVEWPLPAGDEASRLLKAG